MEELPRWLVLRRACTSGMPGVRNPWQPAGPLIPTCLLPRRSPAEKGEGAAELLTARGFALLLMLAECEEPSFMDQARGRGRGTVQTKTCSLLCPSPCAL